MIDRSLIKKAVEAGRPFSQDLKELMKPLESIGITDIAYCQFTHGFRKILLGTNIPFQDNYIAKINDYMESSFVENNTNVDKSPIITSKTDVYEENDLDICYDMARHGLSQWVILQNQDPEKDIRELFWFYAKERKPGILQEIAAHSQELNLFSLYLKDRGKKLLEQASIPDSHIPKPKKLEKQRDIKIEPLSFEIEQYHLGYPFQIHLTKQEFFCLKLSFLGLSAKQIAKKLLLSPRTVESYLNSSKKKLASSKKDWRALLMKCQTFMRLIHVDS